MLFIPLLTVLMNSVVTVPASRWIAIEVDVAKPATIVDATVEVEGSSAKVDALLMSRVDAERFNRGRSFHALNSTGFQSDSHLRYEIEQPGQYVLLLDNRLEGRSPTNVRVRLDLWSSNVPLVRTVPPQKRRVIVVLSVVFFLTVAGFSLRQFLK
jgi:hypothetical protein